MRRSFDANQAMGRQTGARSSPSILAVALLDIMFKLTAIRVSTKSMRREYRCRF
jgi:ATP-dependent protease Clp ATPase subunit